MRLREIITEAKDEILRNALGGFAPRASGSFIGVAWGQLVPGKTRFSINNVSKNYNGPSWTWTGDQEMDDFIDMVKREMRKEGWVIDYERLDADNLPRIGFKHEATEKVAKKAQERPEKIKKQGKKVFVRFGEFPECGKSKNWRDVHLEDGVSVFNAWVYGDDVVFDTSGDAEIGTIVSMMAKRPLYVVSGEQTGFGSDGEPILKNVKLGRRLTGRFYFSR